MQACYFLLELSLALRNLRNARTTPNIERTRAAAARYFSIFFISDAVPYLNISLWLINAGHYFRAVKPTITCDFGPP